MMMMKNLSMPKANKNQNKVPAFLYSAYKKKIQLKETGTQEAPKATVTEGVNADLPARDSDKKVSHNKEDRRIQ